MVLALDGWIGLTTGHDHIRRTTLIRKKERNRAQILHERLHEKVNFFNSLRDMVDRPFPAVQAAGGMDRVPCMSSGLPLQL